MHCSKVAIVGVGTSAFGSITPDVSYKEMMFEAAVKAYEEVGIDPRKDVGSFVCMSEDFLEGTGIFDEYVPDQLGAMLKPVHTITADGLYGLISAYMQISTGLFDIVVIEAHSKASNILSLHGVINLALDPIYNRPLGINPLYIAGMEMNRYLHDTCSTPSQCALVVKKNRAHALNNPLGVYGAKIEVEDVLNSEPMFSPLNRLDIAPHADGCVVMVLASERVAKELSKNPVWIRGVGWCSDSPSLEQRGWGEATYSQLSAEMAYRMANIKNPIKEIDLVEVDDQFSYKELQHLEALGLCRKGEAGALLEQGAFDHDQSLPVNISGGSLGVGYLLEASGLQRAHEVVLQLRCEAGKRQLKRATTGLVHSWRGLPTTSGAVVILSNQT